MSGPRERRSRGPLPFGALGGTAVRRQPGGGGPASPLGAVGVRAPDRCERVPWVWFASAPAGPRRATRAVTGLTGGTGSATSDGVVSRAASFPAPPEHSPEGSPPPRTVRALGSRPAREPPARFLVASFPPGRCCPPGTRRGFGLAGTGGAARGAERWWGEIGNTVPTGAPVGGCPAVRLGVRALQAGRGAGRTGHHAGGDWLDGGAHRRRSAWSAAVGVLTVIAAQSRATASAPGATGASDGRGRETGAAGTSEAREVAAGLRTSRAGVSVSRRARCRRSSWPGRHANRRGGGRPGPEARHRRCRWRVFTTGASDGSRTSVCVGWRCRVSPRDPSAGRGSHRPFPLPHRPGHDPVPRRPRRAWPAVRQRRATRRDVPAPGPGCGRCGTRPACPGRGRPTLPRAEREPCRRGNSDGVDAGGPPPGGATVIRTGPASSVAPR